MVATSRAADSGERGGEVRWRVHGEVGQHLGAATSDHESAECVAVVDALGSPAALPSGSFQRVACRRDVATVWSGEEIEVFRGPRGEVLREQGCSPGQQETLARGQRKEEPGDFQLEVRQVRRAVRPAVISASRSRHLCRRSAGGSDHRRPC